jgi:hypothetical protein
MKGGGYGRGLGVRTEQSGVCKGGAHQGGKHSPHVEGGAAAEALDVGGVVQADGALLTRGLLLQ